MNIFSVNTDPKICAIELDDKRLNKMIVESCQLLSTYCHLNNIHIDGLYKPCYQNHPCQQWLKEDLINVYWLISLTNSYLKEYEYRREKKHACNKLFIKIADYRFIKNKSDQERIVSQLIEYTFCNVNFFPECFGIWKDKIDMSKDHYARMQQLMNLKWHNDKIQPTWSKREIPYYY